MLLFPLKQSRPVCLWAGIFWNISATDSRLPLPWCFLLQIVHHLYFIYLPLGLPNSQTARLWPLAWRLTLTCFPGVWCARNTTIVLLVLVLVVNFVHEHHELGFYPFVGNGRVYRESVWQFRRTSVASPSEALWVYMQVSYDTTQLYLANASFSLFRHFLHFSTFSVLQNEHHLSFLLPCRLFNSALFPMFPSYWETLI